MFSILKKSKKSWARLGIIETPHGVVETPTLVPVATRAAIKTLCSEQVLDTKSKILICNTFHLHLRPGEKIVKSAQGLHKFMNWNGILMTDSGGFQVFSLGFGHDLQVGKVLKMFPGRKKAVIDLESRPKKIKITEDGVFFNSPIDGKSIFIGPKESIKIQESLGADIIFAFDECTSPLSTVKYVKKSLERTHEWARACVRHKKSNQALFGIVQGSRFKSLRTASARFINSLDFQGFGIGGDVGSTKSEMIKILKWTIPELNEAKPRHMLGIGALEDIENIVRCGIDTFDCTIPSHYARHGTAFTSAGKLNLKRSLFLRDKKPLDTKCACAVCQSYKRNYISHLMRANEITGMQLLTIHNLYFFNTFVEKIREKIKNGKL